MQGEVSTWHQGRARSTKVACKEKVERLKQNLLCLGAERHWGSLFLIFFFYFLPTKVSDKVSQLSPNLSHPAQGSWQLLSAASFTVYLALVLHLCPGSWHDCRYQQYDKSMCLHCFLETQAPNLGSTCHGTPHHVVPVQRICISRHYLPRALLHWPTLLLFKRRGFKWNIWSQCKKPKCVPLKFKQVERKHCHFLFLEEKPKASHFQSDTVTPPGGVSR